MLHAGFAQVALTFSPEKPNPGKKISFRYDASNTSLMGHENPVALVYLLEGKLPLVREVKLTGKGNKYAGEFTTNDTTRAFFISFGEEDKKDNNNDQGYYGLLYDETGKPVKGAKKDVASAFSSYGSIWGLKRNVEEALRLSREELAANSELNEKPLEVVKLLLLSKDKEDIERMKTLLNKLVANTSTTEADLSEAKIYFENSIKDKPRANEIDSIIRNRYPGGTWVKAEAQNKYYREKDPAKKELMFADLKKDIGEPDTDTKKQQLAGYAGNLAMAYGIAGNFDKLKEYTAYVSDKQYLASIYNSIAWKETGESVHAKPGNVALALPLSARSLELIREQQNDLSNKAPFRTEAEHRKSLDFTYGMYADTYALLLYHSGEFQKAYDIQKNAIELNKRKDVSMNESFAVYTQKAKGNEAAKAELESFVKDGRYSPAMKKQLQEIFLAEKKDAANWDSYIADLEAASIKAKKQELLKKMINLPAPGFKLRDMQGNEVTLASLKGKTVVVDFWATWCGPCIASFPGMKLAVEKYKDDKDVKFVFIDTWENGEKDEVKKNVGSFIEKNAYPFHVLMDEDSKVVEAFDVDGIPTKFIIDPGSRIRFKSVGFSGTADGLVNELALMIEMARGTTAGAPAKKAF